MKKLLFVSLMFLTLILGACNKDEEGTAKGKEQNTAENVESELTKETNNGEKEKNNLDNSTEIVKTEETKFVDMEGYTVRNDKKKSTKFLVEDLGFSIYVPERYFDLEVIEDDRLKLSFNKNEHDFTYVKKYDISTDKNKIQTDAKTFITEKLGYSNFLDQSSRMHGIYKFFEEGFYYFVTRDVKEKENVSSIGLEHDGAIYQFIFHTNSNEEEIDYRGTDYTNGVLSTIETLK